MRKIAAAQHDRNPASQNFALAIWKSTAGRFLLCLPTRSPKARALRRLSTSPPYSRRCGCGPCMPTPPARGATISAMLRFMAFCFIATFTLLLKGMVEFAMVTGRCFSPPPSPASAGTCSLRTTTSHADARDDHALDVGLAEGRDIQEACVAVVHLEQLHVRGRVGQQAVAAVVSVAYVAMRALHVRDGRACGVVLDHHAGAAGVLQKKNMASRRHRWQSWVNTHWAARASVSRPRLPQTARHGRRCSLDNSGATEQEPHPHAQRLPARPTGMAAGGQP